MRYRDLREWIAAARDLGEVRDVRGASWQEDIGRVTEMLHHTDDSPAVLFDDIPATPPATASWRTRTRRGAASR